MAFPLAWSTFTITAIDVEKSYAGLFENVASDNINDYIDGALLEVKSRLCVIIVNKFKKEGKIPPGDLPNGGLEPDDPLDALFTASFPYIRSLIVILTIARVLHDSNEELSERYIDRYNKLDKRVIEIWTDVNADNTLGTSEYEAPRAYGPEI